MTVNEMIEALMSYAQHFSGDDKLRSWFVIYQDEKGRPVSESVEFGDVTGVAPDDEHHTRIALVQMEPDDD